MSPNVETTPINLVAETSGGSQRDQIKKRQSGSKNPGGVCFPLATVARSVSGCSYSRDVRMHY
eukprot:177471-Prorocentrum_minimum.AAC.7